jgi:hypothetical protein
MKMQRYLFSFFLSLLIAGPLVAQALPSDSTIDQHALNTVKALYQQEAGADLLIYNGMEYTPSPGSTSGTAYFEANDADEMSVLYDGQLYEHVRLQYDMATDELIAHYLPTNITIVVQARYVSYFTLGKNKFIYFTPDVNSAGMPAGYYEDLYEGKISIRAKKQREFKLAANAEENSSHYIQYNYYYLQKAGRFYAVKGQQSFLTLLKDRKDQLKKYMSDNHISFKKDFEGSMVKLAGYYDQLTN